MVAKDFQGIHFMRVYSQTNSWCWLRMLVYSPKTFWHEKEWNILTCVLKLHINLHQPTSGWYISKNTCVTCHLWHFFPKCLEAAYFWFEAAKFIEKKSVVWLELYSSNASTNPSIDFQDSVMMISLIWPLRAKGGNRIGESVDLPFFVGKLLVWGFMENGTHFWGGIKCTARWWFQTFFYFQPRKLGRWSNLTTAHMFQRCCETTIQLDFELLHPNRSSLFFFKKKNCKNCSKCCKKLSQINPWWGQYQLRGPEFLECFSRAKNTFFLVVSFEPTLASFFVCHC